MDKLAKLQKKAAWVVAFLLLAAFIFQVGYRIGKEQIKVWDESSSARNSVLMLAEGSYFMVYKDGKRVPDPKPPFQLWLKVTSFKLFGINEFAVRFPTLVSAILTAIALWFFLFYYTKKIWLANFLLLLMNITPGYIGYHVARHGDPDTLLVFELTLYSILYFFLIENYPRNQIKYYIGVGLLVSIAVLTKSIAGLAPAAGFALYTLVQPNGRKMMANYRFYVFGLATLVASSAYFWIAEWIDPGFLHDVYEQNFKVLQHYPGTVKHPEFSFYYNYLKSNAFKPLFYYIPLLLVPFFFSKNKAYKNLILFSFLAATVFLLGQSSAVMKNEWYIAPIYPFLWILVSVSLFGTLEVIINLIPKQKLNLLVSTVIGLAIIAAAYPLYQKIYKRNMNRSYSSNYIYQPEREGNYFREMKKSQSRLKNLKIVSDYAQRSTDFYVQKYKYLEGMNTRVIEAKDVRSVLPGDTLMLCSEKLKPMFEQQFNYEVLDSNRYCKLYHVIAEKESSSDQLFQEE